jgi:hypothetical protein
MPLRLIFPPEVALSGEGGPGDLRAVGRIADLLDVAVDPEAGVALTATQDAELRVYTYPGFRLRGWVRLEHPVYRLALDSTRGRLYAAASIRHFLLINPLGEREDARGDLYVFDVRDLLRGKVPTGRVLLPTARLGLMAHFLGLALCPRGQFLYYQASSRGAAHIARVDALRFRGDRQFGLSGSATGMALSPDGKHLYALTTPTIRMIDPAAWTERKALQYPIPGEHALAAGDNGRVYLADRREPPRVYALDMHQSKVVGNWSAGLRGHVSLQLAPGGDRLFLGTSTLAGGRIWALDVAGEQVTRPKLTAQIVSDRTGVLRGGLFLTPDGQHLLNGSGLIWRRMKDEG